MANPPVPNPTARTQADCPTALEYPTPIGGLNEPVVLHSGPVEFEQAGRTFTADTTAQLEWLPTPGVRFDIPVLPPDEHLTSADQVTIGLPVGERIRDAFVGRVRASSGADGDQVSASGRVNEWAVLDSARTADHALFLLPNFQAPIGKGIRFPDGHGRADRHELVGGGWTIRLDGRRDAGELSESLREQSGFAATHVGCLCRTDGSAFTARDATAALTALGWYISFAQGAWAGPCLPVGMTDSGEVSWRTWQVSRTSASKFAPSWLDHVHGESFAGPFAEFMTLWSDPDWEEVVRVAIHWYVEANNQAGSIEGAITLTQTALELLASGLLVDKHKWVSTDGYEKLAAADRLRLLFAWAGIPTAIPAELNELLAAAKADNWPDAPTAMTAIRNAITHPTKKNREKLGRHPVPVKHNTWLLGLWYLELCLLRLFGYRGVYASRLTFRYQGQVKRVPWVNGP